MSAWGIGQTVHDDGTADFRSFLAEDPRDAMYWVCTACYRLLRQDQEVLLRRRLEAHGTGERN